jgi:hypothetical protein
MGFRFQKRIAVFPGLRVNLSKSGTSVSVGRRGLWATFGPKCTRTTVGIPGMGLSWTNTSSTTRARQVKLSELPAPPVPPPVEGTKPANRAAGARTDLEARRSIDWPLVAIGAVFALIVIALVAAAVVTRR